MTSALIICSLMSLRMRSVSASRVLVSRASAYSPYFSTMLSRLALVITR